MHTHFLFLKSEQCNKSALFSSWIFPVRMFTKLTRQN
jgi:hypothetical protein